MTRPPSSFEGSPAGRGPIRALVPVLLGLLLLTGCSSGSGGARPGADGTATYGASSSELALRQFLDAAGAKDYARMGRFFGTRRGPAENRLGIGEVEQRMVVLAGFLGHREYEVLREANLAQLGPDRKRWIVRLEGTRQGVVEVPVVTVLSRADLWFVEQVVMDPFTRRTGG